MGEMNTLTIILIAAVVVMLFVLHMIYGAICSHTAARKGRGAVRYFWLGFFLGLLGVLIAELRHPKTFVLNPNLKNELMYITWLRQFGALSEQEFEREKKVLYFMNRYM